MYRRHALPIAGIAASLAVGCTFDNSRPPGSGAAADDSDVDAGARPQDPSSPDAAPDVDVPTGLLTAPKVPMPPKLDGDPVDWEGVPRTSFAIADAMHFFHVQTGYDYSASMQFAARHDSRNIYFLVEVTDNKLMSDSEELFHDDSVELYLDARGDGSGPYGFDDHWLVLSNDGAYESFGPDEVALTGAVRDREGGYVVEIGLSKFELGMTPGQTALGFDIGLDDDDQGTPDIDAYGLWWLADRPRCTNCCPEWSGPQPWCDTSMLGRLELLP